MPNASTDLLLTHLRIMLEPAGSRPESDGRLLGRWQTERDTNAFAVLIRRHGPMVWRVARSVLPRTEDAEDVFQATFLVLAQKAAGLRGRASLAGWLYQTAQRLALNLRAAMARRWRHEAESRPRIAEDPLEEISARDAHNLLTEELRRLPDHYREPLVLCFYEGLTQDQAGRRLGCSRKTLQRRLERGRALLGQRLGRRGLDLPSTLPLVLACRCPVPTLVARRTLDLAAHLATGQRLSGGAGDLAASLLRTMLIQKLTAQVLVFLAVGAVLLVAGIAFSSGNASAPADNPGHPAQALAPADPRPHLDRYGDPLPPGVLQRIGCSRLRHGGIISEVRYTPDGRAVASICADGFVRLWDAQTGKLRWSLSIDPVGKELFHRLVISSDGQRLAVLTGSKYTVLAIDNGNRLLEHVLKEGKEGPGSASEAISPDLRLFARASWDAKLHLLDAETGQEKWCISTGDPAKFETPKRIQFTKDGKAILAIQWPTPVLTAYEAETGAAAWTQSLEKGNGNAYEMAFSHDGRFVVGAFGNQQRLLAWDLTGTRPQQLLNQAFNSVICCDVSPDGRLLVVAGQDPDIVFFDTATGKEKQRWHWHQSTLRVAFAPDGKTLASADNAGCITLWDLATGKPLPGSATGIFYAGLTSHGRQVLSVTEGIQWWDVKTGALVRELPKDPAWYGGRALSPDGKLLAACLPNGTINLIDTNANTKLRTLTGHKHQWIFGIAFSPDGSKLFSAGGFDPRVIIWDVATGKPLHFLQHTTLAERIVASPNGRWLASWAADQGAPADADIRLWEVATGKLVYRLPAPGAEVRSAAFSADSSLFVAVGGPWNGSSGRGEIHLWDLTTGKSMRSFFGHEQPTTSVALSPDSRMLATGSWDHTLRLWEIATGSERRRIVGHLGYVEAVDFLPDGKLLAASDDAPVYIWDPYALEGSAPAPLTAEDSARLWEQLADLDAAKAYPAQCTLIAHPGEAIRLLQDNWPRSPRASTAQMQQWLADLESSQFEVRRRANDQLQKFATGHEGLLAQAQEQTTSAEVRRRVGEILKSQNPQRVRCTRMLEILERIGTAPARQFLQTLVRQTDDAELSRQATAGLQRLQR